MRVLIVDDSVVFRSQIKAALEGAALIEVVGVANNGKIAIQKLGQLSVDLVTLDMEMPEMGGLETIREIKKLKYPVRIIVFSSHTTRGSEMAIEALALGADDFLPKPVLSEGAQLSDINSRIRAELLPKINQFIVDPSKSKSVVGGLPGISARVETGFQKKDISTFLPHALVVGSSTGGPPALEKVLGGLKPPLKIPIFIVQHMPPVFTASLAKRIQDITGIPSEEAKNEEEVKANHIYVAPGNYHMSLKKTDSVRIVLDQAPQRNSVRPAVDVLFESAAKIYGTKCMAVVLTGMGEDGMLGCRAIKQSGGGVMIQDKESCVVFGMPGAVFQAGCYDEILNPQSIFSHIKRMVS